eukprot:scaffold189338_cov50-Attheya_sp.AAC.1
MEPFLPSSSSANISLIHHQKRGVFDGNATFGKIRRTSPLNTGRWDNKSQKRIQRISMGLGESASLLIGGSSPPPGSPASSPSSHSHKQTSALHSRTKPSIKL